MAIDFPASPTTGQTFTSGTVTYTWDGTKWTAVTGSVLLDKIEEGNTSAEVIDTGSDGRFVVTTEGAEALRIDSSGRLLVGTSSARTNLGGVEPKLQVEGTSFTDSAISAVANSTTASTAPSLVLARSRGAAIGSNTAVLSGNLLGRVRFQGNDGTDFYSAAFIACEADANAATGSVPGRIQLLTTPVGASDPVERMRIASNGYIYMYSVYNNPVVGSYRDVYVESGGFVGYLSSVQAHKTNIQPVEDVDWLYSLNPVSFNRRKKDEKGVYSDEFYKENEYGLIAEEVEPIAPQLCFYDLDEQTDEKTLAGVHYRQLITPMLKALQQANTRIEALEAKVMALESN